MAQWLNVPVSDWRLRGLRDRHYSGGVGGRTVGAPGPRVALVTFEGDAGFVAHAGYEALGRGYVCSFFRNEGDCLSSALITAGIEAVERCWPRSPRWVTMVDPQRVRPKRDPGRCFRRAGFRVCGVTKDRGLLVLELLR